MKEIFLTANAPCEASKGFEPPGFFQSFARPGAQATSHPVAFGLAPGLFRFR